MQAEGVLAWLERTPVAQAMRSDLWTYPVVEIIHIIGFVALVGSVLMFDLRLLGLSKSLPVQMLARHLLRWTLLSLLLVLPAGVLMFSAHPSEFIANPVFLLKLTLIALAGCNALLFHRGAYRTVDTWDVACDAPTAAKTHALISVLLWLSVIACGRLLAYT